MWHTTDVQRYCDGCCRYHDLAAFDLDRNEPSLVCRAHIRAREKTFRASERRRRQTRIEALEQQRRRLIAALVNIDQEIAKERSFQASTALLPVDAADVFGVAIDSCD